MSGKKISEMTAITGAQLDQTNDVLPVLDVSDTTNPNKKISIQELASALGAGTTNVDLSLDGSNNLTLTDSDNNTVTVDLSSLDNASLTLADVTANGAVTGEDVTINSVSGVSTGQLLIQRNNLSLVATNGSGNNGSLVFYTNNAATYAAGINSFTDNEWVVTKGSFAGASNQLFKLNDEYATFTGTSHIQLTSGTTAQRPVTPANGMIRYNSDDDVFEGYDGDWGNFLSYENNTYLKNNFFHNFGGSTVQLGYAPGNIANAGATLIFRQSNLASNKPLLVNAAGTASVTLDIQGTDAVQLTSGTTAQRPTAAAGMIRFNTDTSKFEGYDGTAWIDLN